LEKTAIFNLAFAPVAGASKRAPAASMARREID
jgi:hypothetical protein